MHTYSHDESGVLIHHNGDYGGEAIVHLPVAGAKVSKQRTADGAEYWEIEMPCAPLAQFSRWATLSEVTRKLEDMQ